MCLPSFHPPIYYREGIHTHADIEYWMKREIKLESKNQINPNLPPALLKILTKELVPPPFLPFVCPTNAGKDAKNAADLEKRNTPHFVCESRNKLKVPHAPIFDNTVVRSLLEKMKVQTDPALLAKQKKEEGKTKNLPLEFKIKLGSRVEVCTNFDKSDGLYNGACGVVMHVTCTTTTVQHPVPPLPIVIWVKFDDPIIGEKCRVSYHAKHGNTLDPTWTPIRRLEREFTFKLKQVSS